MARLRQRGLLRLAAVAVALALVGGPVAGAAAAPDGDVIYRFYKSDGTHFYTAVKVEAQATLNYRQYRYEGVLGALNFPGADTALHRFYKNDGTHFYTASKAEANMVKGYPQYRYEGVAGQVASTPAAGLIPVYRFYKQSAGTHFYTASEYERGLVMGYAQYAYEGVAYYVKPAIAPLLVPLPVPVDATAD